MGLLGKLEVCILEPHVPSGRNIENKTEIDMDQVPIFIDQDVPVMPILHLQDVTRHRIGR